MARPSNSYGNNWTKPRRSLEQTRAEKEQALSALTANQRDLIKHLTELKAGHDQVLQQLQQQLDQTAASLEKVRTEKEQAEAELAVPQTEDGGARPGRRCGQASTGAASRRYGTFPEKGGDPAATGDGRIDRGTNNGWY